MAHCNPKTPDVWFHVPGVELNLDQSHQLDDALRESIRQLAREPSTAAVFCFLRPASGAAAVAFVC